MNKLKIVENIIHGVITDIPKNDIVYIEKFINELYKYNTYTLDKHIGLIHETIVSINQDVITDMLFNIFIVINMSELGPDFLESSFNNRKTIYESMFLSKDLGKYVVPKSSTYDPLNEIIVLFRHTLSPKKYKLIVNT